LTRNKSLLVLGLAIVAMLVYIVVLSDHLAPNDRSGIRVVAAENFWGDIARQIGGDRVNVTSIISDPSADPHLYESNANNAVAVATADIAIENGLGYDDFFDKLLSASGSSKRTLVSASKVLGVTADGANPHLWYDLPRVHLVAAQIEAALAAKDPANKSDYEANLAKFDASMQPLLDKVAQIKSQYPGAPVAYTERVPGYLLADAGLSVRTPEGFAASIEDGSDPSPADTAAMDNLLTSRGVKVLLYNSQATSPVTQHARDLAGQAGIPVVGVSETLPPNEPSYQSWQSHQLDAILKALGNR
jgi:zinc/manganese transport system substrate-binding protein